MRDRRYTDEQLAEALKSSTSINSLLPKLGLSKSGGNHRCVRIRIKKLGLDCSHILGQRHWAGIRPKNSPERTLDEILVQNSDYLNSSRLKKRLIKACLIIDVCAECGILPSWKGKPLVLVLDHINGDHTDNRLSNLRALCPNCNSQQPTFAGRNKKYRSKVVL